MTPRDRIEAAAERTTPIKFTKVDRGWYATADGTYAVMADGYEPGQHVGAEGNAHGTGHYYEGFVAGEWAAIFCRNAAGRTDTGAGENIDWFPTKREAVQCCIAHARRTAAVQA